MFECYTARPQSLVDSNLLVAERPTGRYGEREVKKKGAKVLPRGNRGL